MKAAVYIVTMAVLSMQAVAGAVYKVVNDDGSVTYTDMPQPGAEEVDLSGVKQSNIAPLHTPTNRPSEIKVQPTLPDYSLVLLSPTDGQTIRNNQGRLTVSARLSPDAAGLFELYLDGNHVLSNPMPSFELKNVDRGEHKLQIKFRHRSGKILAQTPVQAFYLHRASALIKAN